MTRTGVCGLEEGFVDDYVDFLGRDLPDTVDTLNELERVAGVFVQICTQIVERDGVDGYTRSDR